MFVKHYAPNCMLAPISKSVTMSKFDSKSSKINHVTFFSAPISMPNIKALAQILFEMSCTQNFQILLSKGHNSKRGHNWDMKKIQVNFFFHEESIYDFRTLAFTVQKFQISLKSKKKTVKISKFCKFVKI